MYLGEGQVEEGLRGQRLQVVLLRQGQGLQEQRQSRGEARGPPVELGRDQQNPDTPRRGRKLQARRQNRPRWSRDLT